MALDEDLKEIYDIFFEESAEGLEVMETGLLSLDFGAADLDTINDIFRAAHSIKGGAGTFGFMGVSAFTHGVETIMDQMRDGKRDVTEENVQLLLESVDCIGTMLECIKNDEPDNAEQRQPIEARITALLAGSEQDSADAAPAAANEPVDSKPESSEKHIWAILHVSWQLQLESDCTEAQISDVFTWVAGQCDLEITEKSNVEEMDTDANEVSTEKADTATLPAKTAPPAKGGGKDKGGSTKSRESASIRVAIDKVDSLLNLVGELVITQSMLRRFGDSYDPDSLKELRDGLSQLERHTRELQESAMQIRMLPINSSFNRFPRLVRDLSTKLGKKIDLVVSGEHTEVDKTVLEKLNDPLVHLVRNSLDHGIEMPDARVTNGKPENGTLHLSAAHEGGNVIIKVEDDGAGPTK